MPARLEIALKDHLLDAEGEGIRRKASDYFGMKLSRVRSVHILTIDADLNPGQLKQIQSDIFTNPVTQVSSYDPLTVASGLRQNIVNQSYLHPVRMLALK